jgi:ABC-2 type transport system ATP-binding protein
MSREDSMTGSPAPALVEGLTKRYGPVCAVDGLSFTLEPGTVTGFLGPNGAGKTTALRILLGLASPTAGRALVFGRPYDELVRPATLIGAVLEATDFHPARSGRDHLRTLALAIRVPERRVDELLALVELDSAARRPVRTYSLGMRQRLALAGALLGDPELLVLDEPANGLDPAGVRWLRSFLRRLAASGKTVLISSHILAEVEQSVDRVLILDRGRLVDDRSIEALRDGHRCDVRVHSPRRDELLHALHIAGVEAVTIDGDSLVVSGVSSAQVGDLAAAAGIAVHELRTESTRLEDLFVELTGKETP